MATTANQLPDPNDLSDNDFDGSDDGGASNESRAGEEGDAAALRAVEQEAMAKGWTSKENYKGPVDKWVDAKTFVERGKNFNSALKSELAAVKKQLETFQGTAMQFKKFHDQVMADKQAELDTLKIQLKRDLRTANREGDDDQVEALESRIDLVDQQKEKLKISAAEVPTPPATPQIDPVLAAWIDNGNEWFRDDAKLRAYSIELGQDLKKSQPNLAGEAFLAEVRSQMEEAFPGKFGKQQRQSPVSGSNRVSNGLHSAKTERDLPREDRELMNRFIKEGWTTKEKFLESYFSRNS